MRVTRFITAAGLALMFAVTTSVSSLAQAKTDEDYDKLMKAIGAANGAMRGAAKEMNAAGPGGDHGRDVAARWHLPGVPRKESRGRSGQLLDQEGLVKL